MITVNASSNLSKDYFYLRIFDNLKDCYDFNCSNNEDIARQSPRLVNQTNHPQWNDLKPGVKSGDYKLNEPIKFSAFRYSIRNTLNFSFFVAILLIYKIP